MDVYTKIFKNIKEKIIKNGINIYLKKWKELDLPKSFKNYKDFILFIDAYLKKYHKHTFILSKKIDLIENKKSKKEDKKIINDKKIPDFNYNYKTKIGKIKFYHFYGGNKDKEFNIITNELQKKINEWNKLGMKGLILDLTKHFGGNMWPVVYGLKDILGETTLFSWNNKKTSKKENKWMNMDSSGKLKHGRFLTDKLKFKNPIAVIVSKDTASSGEFITSIFIGRENCKIFGKNTNKTAGFFSVNGNIKINNDIELVLTQSLETTVDGKFHDNEIIYVKETTKPLTSAKEYILKNLIK